MEQRVSPGVSWEHAFIVLPLSLVTRAWEVGVETPKTCVEKKMQLEDEPSQVPELSSYLPKACHKVFCASVSPSAPDLVSAEGPSGRDCVLLCFGKT